MKKVYLYGQRWKFHEAHDLQKCGSGKKTSESEDKSEGRIAAVNNQTKEENQKYNNQGVLRKGETTSERREIEKFFEIIWVGVAAKTKSKFNLKFLNVDGNIFGNVLESE